MNVDKNARFIISRLEESGYEGFVVGGCVRDSIMNKTPKDWDICTNAYPEDVESIFKDFLIIPTGIKHGTVTIVLDNIGYEVTTYRVDGDYLDGRHPDKVKFVHDVTKDLSRRDFTINSMAYNHKIIDPFGGRLDIQNKTIRCVGDAKKRFEEDKLRILRAIRFASKFGFDIAEDTLKGMKIYSKAVRTTVSAERISEELIKILEGEYMVQTLMDDDVADIFLDVFPEFRPTWKFDQMNPHHCYTAYEHLLRVAQNGNSPVMRLAGLCHDMAKPQVSVLKDGERHFYGHPEASETMARAFLEELRFSNEEIKDVLSIIRYHEVINTLSKKGLLRLIRKIGFSTVERLIEFRKNDIMTQSSYKRDAKTSELRKVQKLFEDIKNCPNAPVSIANLKINGHDLINLGIASGPVFKTILEGLLSEVIDGNLENEHDVLMSHVKDFI